MLFRILFGLAGAFAENLAGYDDLHVKGLVVVRAFFPAQNVRDFLLAVALDEFLEQRRRDYGAAAAYRLRRSCNAG